MTKSTTYTGAGLKQNIAAITGYSDKALTGVRELTAFNKDTLAAITQANQILVAGSQDLLRQTAQSGQEAIAEVQSGIRALVSAKTLKDGLELQASLIRASVTRLLSDSNRLSQASLELAEKIAAPLTARLSLAVETVTARAA
jgi:hypothetical protein